MGRRGEQAAARYLERHGLRILAHSQREAPGEIDLIARDGATIVFVEVKTRSSNERGQPWEAVNAKKQKQVVRSAVAYLHRRRLRNRSIRFDVVGITWTGENGVEPNIVHFPDAFSGRS